MDGELRYIGDINDGLLEPRSDGDDQSFNIGNIRVEVPKMDELKEKISVELLSNLAGLTLDQVKKNLGLENGWHPDLIARFHSYPDFETLLQSPQFADIVSLAKESRSGQETIIYRPVARPEVEHITKQMEITGDDVMKKQIREEEQKYLRCTLMQYDPLCMQGKEAIFKILADLGGETAPVSYQAIQNRYAEEYGRRLNHEELKHYFKKVKAQSVFEKMCHEEVTLFQDKNHAGQLYLQLKKPLADLKDHWDKMAEIQITAPNKITAMHFALKERIKEDKFKKPINDSRSRFATRDLLPTLPPIPSRFTAKDLGIDLNQNPFEMPASAFGPRDFVPLSKQKNPTSQEEKPTSQNAVNRPSHERLEDVGILMTDQQCGIIRAWKKPEESIKNVESLHDGTTDSEWEEPPMTSSSQQISVHHGKSTTKTCTITGNDDYTVEGNETSPLRLLSVSKVDLSATIQNGQVAQNQGAAPLTNPQEKLSDETKRIFELPNVPLVKSRSSTRSESQPTEDRFAKLYSEFASGDSQEPVKKPRNTVFTSNLRPTLPPVNRELSSKVISFDSNSNSFDMSAEPDIKLNCASTESNKETANEGMHESLKKSRPTQQMQQSNKTKENWTTAGEGEYTDDDDETLGITQVTSKSKIIPNVDVNASVLEDFSHNNMPVLHVDDTRDGTKKKKTCSATTAVMKMAMHHVRELVNNQATLSVSPNNVNLVPSLPVESLNSSRPSIRAEPRPTENRFAQLYDEIGREEHAKIEELTRQDNEEVDPIMNTNTFELTKNGELFGTVVTSHAPDQPRIEPLWRENGFDEGHRFGVRTTREYGEYSTSPMHRYNDSDKDIYAELYNMRGRPTTRSPALSIAPPLDFVASMHSAPPEENLSIMERADSHSMSRNPTRLPSSNENMRPSLASNSAPNLAPNSTTFLAYNAINQRSRTPMEVSYTQHLDPNQQSTTVTINGMNYDLTSPLERLAMAVSSICCSRSPDIIHLDKLREITKLMMGDNFIEPAIFKLDWKIFINDYCASIDLVHVGSRTYACWNASP